jgi:mono/diheme cytochrome c family protein
MYLNQSLRWLRGQAATSIVATVAALGTIQVVLAQTPADNHDQVTFAKDIAPLLQRSCQVCHRPNNIAPMSLLTYEEVRPWAKAIKSQVLTREMPPWYIDRAVGIRDFKNDR